MTRKSTHSGSAYQQAYEAIRDRILNGDLPGGTKIVEEKLAAELGFSRTPIRDSLRQLGHEGLIVNKKVVQPTEKDLRNLFQVRSLLEGFSAKSAATYLPEEELKSEDVVNRFRKRLQDMQTEVIYRRRCDDVRDPFDGREAALRLAEHMTGQRKQI